MTTAGSNFISGITTTVFESTDVVNKDYVDANVQPLPSQTGNAGKFLTTTDGTNLSWDYVSNYQEFTSPGISTFNVPSYSNLLFIEAVGAGGGGQSGGASWQLRTSGTTANLNFFSFGPGVSVAGGDSGVLITATDTIIWQLRTSGFSFGAIRASLYVGSEILLGGDHPFIQTSTDAIIWNSYISNNGGNAIYAFGPPDLNGVYTVGGANGYLAASNNYNVSTWNLRTSGTTDTIYALAFGNGDIALSFNAAGTNGLYAVSTNSIVWSLRTSGFGASAIRALSGDGFVAAGDGGKLATSSNSIVWTLRTCGFGTSTIRSLYGSVPNITAAGDGGLVMTTTDTVVWTTRNSPITSNINNVFGEYVAGDNGTIGYYNPQPSGAGGASGSYTSWYIPKSIVSSNITVNPGAGGYGSTIPTEIGGLGGNTTVSWTGPGGTYTLVSNGGFYNTVPGSAQTYLNSSYFYSTAGLTGAAQVASGVGLTATAQTNQFQPTGGGSGAGSVSNAGGSGGAISVYGITTSASGGSSSGANGTNAIAISGLPYGYGGGGGGFSTSTSGNGGNGVRGGGGGGGASGIATFGNGGNGGDGYVKITWW